MELKIKRFDDLSTRELYALMRTRSEVFFLEQKITVEDADEVDFEAVHLWVEEQGEVVGLLRMIPASVTGGYPSIGRLLVRRAWRRRGVCRRLMAEAMRWIEDAWQPPAIQISAQSYLVDFYTELGFEVCSEPYEEAGIEHRAMRYRCGV